MVVIRGKRVVMVRRVRRVVMVRWVDEEGGCVCSTRGWMRGIVRVMMVNVVR